MTLANIIFLTFVVVAFVGYGVLLFTVWLTVEVMGQSKAPKGVSAPAAVEAERPARAGA